MKKIIMGFAVVVTLGLSACSDGPEEPSIADGVFFTKAVYEPGSGNIPLPNDLVFADTLNLTLNPPVVDPTDFGDPTVALSSLDGWSATAPFSFKFSNPDAAVDLDPATVIPGSTVRLYRVNVFRPEVPNFPGSGIIVPSGPVTDVAQELVAGVDFIATYAGPMTVAIIPLKPLIQQDTYMVVVTNGIKDTNNSAIIEDAQYLISKQETPIPTSAGDAADLEPVRLLVNAMENAADADGQPKADIVMSFQFTVQSVGEIVATAKLAYIDFPLSLGQVPVTSFSSLFTDTTPFTGLGAANLYKGQFTLPYYLTAPESLGNLRHLGVANPLSVIQDFFHGAAQVPDGQGGLAVNPFAGDVTTYANRLIAITGLETVPLMVSMPKVALGCNKPAAGYPVMIFQHGLTTNRTNMLGIADTMAAPPICSAVVAMDLPIHGIPVENAVHAGLQAVSGGALGIFEDYVAGGVRERTFGVDYINNETGAPGSDNAVDSSGAHTMNLSSLLMARDNTRQAILDLLALEKAIPFMDIDGDGNGTNNDVPDFDIANIYYLGHSLGGIVGAGFLGHSDYVKAAVLANPASGIVLMLDASPTFGPAIRAGLSSAGVEAGTPDYAAFMFVFQTVIDSGDPASTSAFAITNDIPTLMLQNGNDQLIPNFVATAPQSGTTPMAAFMGLTNVSVTEPGLVIGTRLFSRFLDGGHSSVLSPTEDLAVTVEMQTQIASFLSSGGQAVLVSDPSLLIP